MIPDRYTIDTSSNVEYPNNLPYLKMNRSFDAMDDS